MADRNAQIHDILRRNVTELAHRVINKLSGEGRKRKRATSTKRVKKQPSRGKIQKSKNNIRRDIFPKRLHSRRKHGSGSIVGYFGVRHFAQKPVQTSVQETIETIFRSIAYVDQSDLEFLIPAEHDMYIDLNIRLFVTGKLTTANGKDLEATELTGATNNFLHSLFNQCSITLNGTTITPSTDLHQYRSYEPSDVWQ